MIDLFANSELMWKQSVHSSLVAAHLASKTLKAYVAMERILKHQWSSFTRYNENWI